MQNKTIFTAIVAVVIGLFGGYLIWGNASHQVDTGHVMPGGSMMMNDGSVVPNDMSAMMANMNAGLEGKTGDAFDQEFLAEMIIHHQGAVDMAQLATKNAHHQEIKDLSLGIISAQEKEIAEMKAWQKSWYNK